MMISPRPDSDEINNKYNKDLVR